MACVLLVCEGAAADADVLYAHEPRPHRVATLRVEPVRVGDPPVAMIRAVVHRERWRDLRACYQSGLRTDPKLAGVVVVDLAVDSSGRVTRARAARTTVPDANVVQCMVHAFGAVVFPRMRSAMNVRYPIELR